MTEDRWTTFVLLATFLFCCLAMTVVVSSNAPPDRLVVEGVTVFFNGKAVDVSDWDAFKVDPVAGTITRICLPNHCELTGPDETERWCCEEGVMVEMNGREGE